MCAHAAAVRWERVTSCEITFWGAGIAQCLERRTHDQKVAGSSPGRNFRPLGQLSVLTLTSVSVPPPSYRSIEHVKDPGHSTESAGGRLQLNTNALHMWLCMK